MKINDILNENENEWSSDRHPEDMPEEGFTDHHEALNKTGFWGKQAAGCIFYSLESGKYLINHRSNMVEQPGTWGTWGGAMDINESPMQAVSREIHEETGYTGSVDLMYVWTFQHSSGFKYHNYIAVVPSEFTPILDWESQGYIWVILKHLPKPLHFGLVGLLQQSEFFRIMSNL